MFILGFLGVVGSIMYGMITGGGIGPFLHGGAALFVFATSFFAGLAMSKGEFNEKCPTSIPYSRYSLIQRCRRWSYKRKSRA